MGTITLKARAKINLTLDVLAKRPDGYHEVEMIMHPIDLYDTVTITTSDDGHAGTVLTSSVDYLPLDSGNIAFQAVEILREAYGFKETVNVHIEKRIPVAAGLAGGSTNAAAVLEGVNRLLGLGVDQETLMVYGKKLGADVPFCMLGGPAIARGIGEQLTPIIGMGNTWAVLSKPSIGVSTKDVYGNLDVDAIQKHPDTARMLKAMEAGDIREVQECLVNVLEEVTLPRYPIVSSLKAKFKEFGAKAPLMSGSGPTVFALFKEQSKAEIVYANMAKRYAQTYMVRLYDGGTRV